MTIDSLADTPPFAAGSPPLAERPGLDPGTSVGRYLVVDRVGEGGMGVVYKAYDPQLGRTVALKLVRAARDTELRAGGTLRERFLREARALALLSHPNVINVHDAGTFGDDVFIAMEFVEGPTLSRWLRAERRGRRQILDVFLAAGAGLVAAHAAGLVHRDFKPENVIVSPDGRVRVLDFGLARAADADEEGATTVNELPPRSGRHLDVPAPPPSRRDAPRASSRDAGSTSSDGRARSLSSLTSADAIMGTPRFMAPEQHLGHPVDERADQFSFCVALYSALYDAPPFAGDKVTELAENVILGKVSDPPSNARVPRWLRQVLLRGLAVEPRDRFPSMSALLAALRADPSISRGRWAWTSLAVAAVASAGVAWRVSARSQERACAGAADELRGVWDAPRREAVEAAFRASALPYAESVLQTVEATLDQYAASWAAMHEDACEATRVRGEQSQELLDLRMACLDDRRTELRTVAEVFASPDPKGIQRAAEAAQALPRLDPCADAAALRAPIPPPRDPEVARAVTGLREELAKARALHVAGKNEQSAPLANDVLARAQALAYAPLESEAAYLVGELQGDQGDYEGAGRSFHRALVAATAGHHDEAAARATIALVHANGAMHSHFEEAEGWAELAEASVSRLKQKDELLGSLYAERSVVRRRQSQLEPALEDAKRALELQLRVFGPKSDRVVSTYHFLGNAYYAVARYADALEAYGHARDLVIGEVGADHPKLAPILIGLGNAKGDLGKHDEALADYRHALALLQRSAPEDPDIATVHNNLGDELQGMGRLGEAREEYRQAMAWSEKKLGPSYEVVMVMDNLGEVSLDLGDASAAMDYFTRARTMAEEVLGPGHALYAGALWGIGESYRRQGRLDDAWTYFQRSLPIAEKALGPDHPILAKPLLLGIGLVQIARHDPAAVATLERAAKLEGEAAKPGDMAAIQAALAQARGSRPGLSAPVRPAPVSAR